MPTLPTPLTEDGLRSLMRDPRYRNPAHPEHDVVRGAVIEGYRIYPGPVDLDATGRPRTNVASAISSSTHNAGGYVHVRSYVRHQDGKAIQVSEYDRSAGDRGSGPSFQADTPAGRQALDRIEQHYRDIAASWREQGLPTAVANLERFLNGTGGTVRLSRDEATRFQWIRDAEAENNERFVRRTFVGDSKSPSVKGLINLPADGSPVSLEDNWTRDLLMGEFLAGAAIGDRDFALAYGQAKLQSKGEFTAWRRGSTIFIEGIITHNFADTYDFHPPAARRRRRADLAAVSRRQAVSHRGRVATARTRDRPIPERPSVPPSGRVGRSSRMMRVLLVVGRWCRRHKLFVSTLCLIGAVGFVPMFPYFPDCDQYPYAVYKIRLSDRYRIELTEYLESFEVHYIVLDDIVLLRFWDWLNDPGSWILNASNKAVFTLIDREFNPWLEDPPARIKALADAARDPGSSFIKLDCELVRAVAIEGW